MTSGLVHESPVNATVEWYTPPWVFDALGLEFDLDPCSGPGDLVPARRKIRLPDDGLAAEWSGRVWLNPPYGPHTPVWLSRLADHGDGIALVFSRTDTAWFHESAARADVACFMRGRVRFLRDGGEASGAPGAGSVLLAYGETCAAALLEAGLGLCAPLGAGRVP
jgi:hypothetical protein